jgi:peptide/nickel transport system substrate-binding protein
MGPDTDTASPASGMPDAFELVAPRRSRFGVRGIVRTFSPAELLAFYFLSGMLFISGLVLLAGVNSRFTTEVPTRGGTLVEGAVGTPRFINPLLAISQPDTDLAALIYSGLLRSTFDANYLPDIASSYEISEDGTVYTLHLREGLVFHDGAPLTSADVLFTVTMAQHPDVKSPRRADWEGVRAEAPDELTVVFTLPHAYAPFKENLTLGILPKHLWEAVPATEFPFSSLNTHPVGSGPFQIADIVLDATGAPETYTLRSFKKFALGTPHLSSITYHTYVNVEELLAAYERGDISSFVADSPQTLARDIASASQRIALARVFGVFFNQSRSAILAHPEVRAALEAAIDKNALVENVLGGYGTPLDRPVPPGLLAPDVVVPDAHGADVARDILTRNGWRVSAASSTDRMWKKGEETLTLTLSTADTPELVASAQLIADAWTNIDIPTTIQVYPLTEFNQTILRPRNFDAILFGEVVGRSLDLFAFWHSSQRNDPGLNLALYTSAAADRSLAAARSETDPEKRFEYLREFLITLAADRPAIFLYSPDIVYILPSHIKGAKHGTLAMPADRFTSVYEWYRDTERVWNVFK